MHDATYRLIYYSRNHVGGTPEEMEAAIRQILDSSRRNNPRVGVTGALMFNAGCFAQVLEGRKAAVEATFERIRRDPRHGDVSVLAFGPVDGCSFDRWSMAFVGASALHEAAYRGIATETGHDPSRMGGEAVFDILRWLVLEDEESVR